VKPLKYTYYYEDQAQVFTLFFLTDLHVGAAACDENLLRADIEKIRQTPNAFWIGGGDYIEAIGRKDKRTDEHALAPFCRGVMDVIGAQRDRVIDMLTPIMPQCIALVGGNHEHSVYTHGERNIYWEIVSRLAERDNRRPQDIALGYEGFVNLVFRRGNPDSWGRAWMMAIYTSHGYGGGRLSGGDALALERVLGRYGCDLALMGHRHVLVTVNTVFTQTNRKGDGIEHQIRQAAFVPSYLHSYIPGTADGEPVSSYSQRKGLYPTPLGTFPIIINPAQKGIVLQTSNTPGLSAYTPAVPGGGFSDGIDT